MGTEEYFIQLAIDTYGCEVRDNSREELVKIGQSIEYELEFDNYDKK